MKESIESLNFFRIQYFEFQDLTFSIHKEPNNLNTFVLEWGI